MKKGYNFIDDGDKMRDFMKLSKEDFLQSYAYLTEEDYDETVKLLFHKCFENYRVISVKDLCYPDKDYGYMLLNVKHTIDEFDTEIINSKQRHEEEIAENGDDFEYIFGDELLNEKIDYEWLDTGTEDLYV